MTLQEFYNNALQLGVTPESEIDFDVMSVRKINNTSFIRVS